MRDRLFGAALGAAGLVARRAPTWLSYRAAGWAGDVAFYAWPRGRKATLANFACVLAGSSPTTIRAVARASLANYARFMVDFLRFPGLAADGARGLVHGAEGYAVLERALSGGRGAIVVCTHFGNWDLGAAGATARGFPLAVVAESFNSPRLDAFVVSSRERLGMRVLRRERAGPSLLRSLRRNEALALLVDRPLDGDGVRARFFGGEVEVPAGPARLALAAGAPVIPCAFARVKRNEPAVRLLVDGMIEPEPTGDRVADVRRITEAILAAHESYIRAYPSQWYMFRRMWP